MSSFLAIKLYIFILNYYCLYYFYLNFIFKGYKIHWADYYFYYVSFAIKIKHFEMVFTRFFFNLYFHLIY